MKLLSYLAYTLCVVGSLGTFSPRPDPFHNRYLLPRAKGDATQPHESSNRGGLNRDRAQPPYKPAHSEQDAQRARDVIARGKRVEIPPPEEWPKSSPPPEGESGYQYDEEDNYSYVYQGDALEVPARLTEGRERHDPSERGYPYQPRADTKQDKKDGNRQRRGAYRSIPSEKGLVRDHKGPVSSHYAKEGQVSTVAYDNERSQNFEGNLLNAANKPVRENGYDDPTDASTWKKGGVIFVPNQTNKQPLRPEIGFQEENPYKYTVYDDIDDVPTNKRDRSSSGSDKSRHSSRSSQTLVTKPPKKSSRHSKDSSRKPSNNKRRRDIAGVGAIASTEATAASTTSNSQNSTQQTSEDLQAYLDAWSIVCDNATTTLWPFIADMLEGTNSSLVITAAWSVWAHMIPTNWQVVGPFQSGWTSLYMQEQEWATSGNFSNATLAELYAIDDVLLDLYGTAWDGGFQALNSTGILDDLNWLTQTIQYYNASLPIPTFPEGQDPYENFFLSYYSVVPSDELDLNQTVAWYPNGTLYETAASPTGTVFPRHVAKRF